MATNPYAKYLQQAQAPAAPMVVGSPRQPDPSEVRKDTLDAQLKELQIAEMRRKEEERRREEENARTAAEQVGRQRDEAASAALSAIDSARQQIGGFSTGLAGQVLEGVGGTTAKDLNANLNTIRANLAFDKLQAMRDASPTGGALGQVTEIELKLLQDSLASLDNSQSADQLRRNLDAVERHYRNFVGALGGKMPEEAIRDVPPVAVMPSRGQGEGGEPQQPISAQDFNAEIDRRIRAGHGVEQINAFAMSRGFSIPDQEALQQAVDLGRAKVVSGDSDVPEALTLGAADALTFGFLDELGAVVDTLGGTQGRPNILEGGSGLSDIYRQNLRANREILSNRRDVNPGAFTAGQIGGAVAIPFGAGARGAAQLGKVGAAQGATYGAGSANGDIGDRVQGAALGGAAGAIGGAAFGAAAPRVGNAIAALRGNAAPSEANALVQAADRLGIEVLPADVGGPVTRRTTAAAAQFPISAAPIIRGGQRTLEQAGSARNRIASETGRVMDAEGAGEAARAGADKFRANTAARAERLYDRAEKLSQGARIVPTRAMETIERHIAELSEIPGGSPELPLLQRLRDEMAKGNFSINGVRGMRTALRNQFMQSGLRSSDIERRIGEIVNAASEDITQNLAENGLDEAANAYRAADGFWRTRVQTIDKALTPILGKDGSKSGEQVLSSLESQAKSNGRRLQQFIAALPEEEANTVRATIISRLGSASPGAQNAEGTAFSLNTFLTQWSKMTPRAKATLFKGDTRKALDDLAKVAGGVKESARFANQSNTGSVIGMTATMGSGLGGIPVMAFAGLSQLAAGRLLSSPAIARWLAGSARMTSPQAMRAHVGRLGNVATKTPAIRNEVIQLQQRLADSFSRPLAAEEEPAPVKPN